MYTKAISSLIACCLFPVLHSQADPLPFLPEEMNTREGLTGDWNGVRSKLAGEHGITFSLTYIGEVFGNLSGGLRTGAAYDGLLAIALEVELEKLTGGAWKGGTFFASALVPHGESPTSRYVGDIFSVSNIDAPHTTRLYEIWLEQNIDLFSLRVGQMAADAEFAISDVSSLFLNGTFGWPAGISANAPAPAYPIASLGARLRIDLNEQASLAAGFYDGDPADVDAAGISHNPHGVHWTLNKQQGMFAIFEFAYLHHQDHKSESCIPPGFVKVGTWIHTGQFADNSGGQNHGNNFGIYAIADQKLFLEEAESDEGLSGFARFFYSPENRSFFDFYCDCGLVYTGLIPTRSEDQFGVAFGYGSISGDLGDAQRAAGGPVQTDTAVLEFSYYAAITPWFSVQPDLQYIIQPDGASTSTGGIADAVVVGVRFQVDF